MSINDREWDKFEQEICVDHFLRKKLSLSLYGLKTLEEMIPYADRSELFRICKATIRKIENDE